MNLERAYGSEVPRKVSSGDVSRSCEHFRRAPLKTRGSEKGVGRGDGMIQETVQQGPFQARLKDVACFSLVCRSRGKYSGSRFPFCTGSIPYPVQLKGAF